MAFKVCLLTGNPEQIHGNNSLGFLLCGLDIDRQRWWVCREVGLITVPRLRVSNLMLRSCCPRHRNVGTFEAVLFYQHV